MDSKETLYKLRELIGEEKQTIKQPSIIAKSNGNEEKQTQNTNYTDYWETKILNEVENEC